MNSQDSSRKKSPVEKRSTEVLSSEKREDIWAILLAAAIMLLSIAAPEAVYQFFKKALFLF